MHGNDQTTNEALWILGDIGSAKKIQRHQSQYFFGELRILGRNNTLYFSCTV